MKYTPERLKEMAEETICSYNMGEQEGAHVVMLLAAMYQTSPDIIIQELHKFCNI